MHHLAAAAVSNSVSSETNPQNSRQMADYKTGATNLILDGTPINQVDQGNSVIEFEARLNPLPKIPTSRLGKGATALIEGDNTPSIFPPAFAVVLGNMPSYLSHRIFTSNSFQHVFSQPSNNVPIQPSAAAIIAAPADPKSNGCLFYPIGEVSDHSQQEIRQASTVVGNSENVAEVDETTAAVAELTSDVPAVNLAHTEQYEEDIDESIQISTS